MKRNERYNKYLKTIDEAHWANGTSAPWKCSYCNEKDGYYIKPAIFYGEPIHDGYNYYLRFEIYICPRCLMICYGGFSKSKDLIIWEQTDDTDPTVHRISALFVQTVLECQGAFKKRLKIPKAWK